MNVTKLIASLENCPCGQRHTAVVKRVEIFSGARFEVGRILRECGFPDRLLVVADENTLRVSEGVLASLEGAGFLLKKLIYKNFIYARAENVEEVSALCADVDGIVSVGSGSLNDICRVPAARLGKRFCIFGTAPSMDGFASGTSPILNNNFKETWQAEQPEVIIGDTAVLAKAPLELKAAGLGDMIAKYVAITDWKISSVLTGEIFCDRIAEMTLEAVDRCVALADKVPTGDEEAAGAIMEALILSGLAMRFAGCSRPASGGEHMVSHYLECYKCLRGIWPEFHGKKVGVASLLLARAYRRIADEVTEVTPGPDPFDLTELLTHFDPQFHPEIAKLNTAPITDVVSPETVRERWPLVREAIYRYVPDYEFLLSRMRAAGAALTIDDIHVPRELMNEALRWHSYMRHRVFLTRLLPMAGIDVTDYTEL